MDAGLVDDLEMLDMLPCLAGALAGLFGVALSIAVSILEFDSR